jgi:hypothetical protein
MRLLASLTLLVLGSAATLSAQRSLGYWFIAPGGATAAGQTGFLIHMGGGGEFAIGKGVAVGVELGAIGPKRHYTDNVMGLASANGYYHFRHSRDIRLDPFLGGGYSLTFRHGTANLGNLGGGLNYWFTSTLGFRCEFRDHVLPGTPTTHFWGLRMGLSFTSMEP